MNKLISACMIVKNEENVIERCLSSIKDYVDEIIIIDTGSTDRTREIASAYTDLIYDFEWINDFSAARNEGIRRATSQWVFIIDADEYFPPDEAQKFQDFLKRTPPQAGVAYVISVVNFLGDSELTSNTKTTAEVPRLFPNHFNICYTRPIHEQLHNPDGKTLDFYLAPGSLMHTGYLKDTVLAKDKLTRNGNIIAEMKKKQGLEAYDYFTIGNEMGVKRDLPRAVYYYERGLKKGERSSHLPWYPRCAVSLTKAYMELNRTYDAWKLVEDKLSPWNSYPEYYSLKGSIYYHLGLYGQAKNEYLAALQASEKLAEKTHVFWLDSPDYASTFPLRVLQEIASTEIDTEKSIYYLSKLLIQNPYDFRAMGKLLTILSFSQSAQDIYRLVESFGETDNRKYQLFLFKSALVAGKKELASQVYGRLSDVASVLNPLDLLNFALLDNNQERFDACCLQLNNHTHLEFDTLVTLTLGSLVWGKNYLTCLSIAEDHILYESYQFFASITKDEPITSVFHIYQLLIKSYLYQFFEIYDRLVNAYSSTETTNALANFFYSEKQYDLAMNYYSLLLKNDALDTASLENLAHYHIAHNYIEDGLDFLLQVIARRPDELRFYTLYLQHCSDSTAKQKFIRQYGDKFAFYHKIPVLARLF